jgi:hypothetical protein
VVSYLKNNQPVLKHPKSNQANFRFRTFDFKIAGKVSPREVVLPKRIVGCHYSNKNFGVRKSARHK